MWREIGSLILSCWLLNFPDVALSGSYRRAMELVGWDRIGGASLFPYLAGIPYGRWRRDSFEAGDSEADDMRIFFYAWSAGDEKAVDMWSHLLPC